MITTTNLRNMRLKYGISLMDLEKCCTFSNQYLSRLELGLANRTSYNEKILDAAIVALIESRREALDDLEQYFVAHRGLLLETLEVESE